MMLAVRSVSGSTPPVSGGPARPAAGQAITLTVTVTNSGGTAAAFTLGGQLVLSGTTTVEGNLFNAPNPSSGATPTPASGTAPAGGGATVTLYSGGIDDATAFANYNASAGFDVILTRTETSTRESAVVPVPSVVFAATPAPASLSVTSVSIAVG